MGERFLTAQRKRWLAAWAPALLWMLLVFALSSIPDVPERQGLPHARSRALDDRVREVAHVVEYGVLAGLLWRAWAPGRSIHAATLGAAGLSLVYALSDELHQSLVPGRTCSIQDGLVDALGIALALLLIVACRRHTSSPAASAPDCR